MKDWITYLRENNKSEIWGFIFLDYYRASGSENPSKFIEDNTPLFLNKEDIVEFHRVFLKVCVQLMIRSGKDIKQRETDIFDKSLFLIRQANIVSTQKEFENIVKHYDDYGSVKAELFRAYVLKTLEQEKEIDRNETNTEISVLDLDNLKNGEDFKITSTPFKKSKRLTVFKLFVFQFPSVISEWLEKKNGLYYPKDNARFEKIIKRVLREAHNNKIDLLVFPELSVPESCVETIRKWSVTNPHVVIIGGSHYFSKGRKIVSRCPVLHGGAVYYTEKIYPSQEELRGEGGLSHGDQIRFFEKTPIGNFFVLICSDNLMPVEVRSRCLKYRPDVIIVPAFQKNSAGHFVAMSDSVNNSADMYYVYSNNKVSDHADGRSSFFGVTSGGIIEQFKKKGYTNFDPEGKVFEIGPEEDYFILQVNLENKRPPAKRKVSDKLNIEFIKSGTLFPQEKLNGQFKTVSALEKGKKSTDTAKEKNEGIYQKDLNVIITYVKDRGLTMLSFDKLIQNVNRKYTEKYVTKIIEAFPKKIRMARLSGKPGIKIMSRGNSKSN